MTKRRLRVLLLLCVALAGIGAMGIFTVGTAFSCGGIDVQAPLSAPPPPPVEQPLARLP